MIEIYIVIVFKDSKSMAINLDDVSFVERHRLLTNVIEQPIKYNLVYACSLY